MSQVKTTENNTCGGATGGCGCLLAFVSVLLLFFEDGNLAGLGSVGLAFCAILAFIAILCSVLKTKKEFPNRKSEQQTVRQFTSDDFMIKTGGSNGNISVTISGTDITHTFNELLSNGILTKEEFENVQSFWRPHKDKTQQALETLSKLHQLMKQGAISESEYNIKKWEILSEKLVK